MTSPQPRSIARRAVRATGLRRTSVAAARMCCERHVLARFGGRRERPGGRILCYHSVGTPQWGVNDVSPARFRRQIETALAAGYRFVPAASIAATGGAPHDLAITFDDGLASVAANAAPVLAEYGIPWTLFVVSDWAAGRNGGDDALMLRWREIERLAGAGATIGSHSVDHANFGALSPEATGRQLHESAAAIERALGIRPAEFAIPFGRSRDWTAFAAASALEAGYTTVYAQAEERRAAGTVPRTFVSRFDGDRVFRAALAGAFDRWEEWY